MPFLPGGTLSATPLATIFFTGQIIFEPSADGMTCEVYVNRGAANHELLVEVRQKRSAGPDLILMRHQGRLNTTTAGRHGMRIEMTTDARGVKRYDGPDVPGASDLGRAINLPSLYRRGSPPGRVPDLTVDPAVARPSFFLNHGVVYSAKRTDRVFELKKGGTHLSCETDFADIVGVQVPLEGINPLTITWRPQGAGARDQAIEIKPSAQGFSHEIYIINDPPFEPVTGPLHDELDEYFVALNRVPRNERFSLTLPPVTSPPICPQPITSPPGPDPERGSPRLPCMPILLDP